MFYILCFIMIIIIITIITIVIGITIINTIIVCYIYKRTMVSSLAGLAHFETHQSKVTTGGEFRVYRASIRFL